MRHDDHVKCNGSRFKSVVLELIANDASRYRPSSGMYSLCHQTYAERRTDTLKGFVLGFPRSGDTLIVTRIDRLARSIKDLQDIVHMLKERASSSRRPSNPSIRAARLAKPFWTVLFVGNVRIPYQMGIF
jgi:hypothetical protein